LLESHIGMMERVKVIGDITELVPILRAINTKIKRKVFEEIISDWKSLRDIEDKYGEDGKESLIFFEKIKLVDSKWQSDEKPEKVYHSYYTSFHINTSCPITEISDVQAAAMMSEEEFKVMEEKILELTKEEGKFVGDIATALNISQTMLRGIIRRSTKLDYRGHKVERKKLEG